MPLYRRLPKRGFTSINKESFKIINLYQINYLIKNKKLKKRYKARRYREIGDI